METEFYETRVSFALAWNDMVFTKSEAFARLSVQTTTYTRNNSFITINKEKKKAR